MKIVIQTKPVYRSQANRDPIAPLIRGFIRAAVARLGDDQVGHACDVSRELDRGRLAALVPATRDRRSEAGSLLRATS
jgi:hypothetical protein